MLRKIKTAPKKKQNIPAGPPKKSFPIVGIGGSAGGLEAFQELLTNISDKPGLALVFIMHLAPGHKSLLSELLARKTKMPVSDITNGMVPEINHVYIKPSGTNLSMASGRLILSVVENEKVKRMPIDYFFHSLADELGNGSIGVILSGTATDGTLGMGSIKAAGGITFAEDEKSAAYDDMPKSAIATGCVDFVLSPKKIAGELEHIARHPLMSSAAPFKPDEPIIMEDKGFESIFDILCRVKGLDFTYYKTATMARRISRRIILTKQGDLKNYIKFLRENNDEAGYLYEDLLINVTNFFRDPKAFHALEKLVIPKILKNRTKNQGVRILVPGCSSGEEAYSIAMLFTEALGRNAGVVSVNIFATDMSETGINKARRGVYCPSIKGDVTPIRLKRFFTKEGKYYKISKSLRNMCVFSKQNVFSDPPFSNLDIISCRNLFIYFQPMLQKRIFRNFHYGLKPNGFLFLGNSESAAGYSNLFKDLDRRQKIFVKKYVSIMPGLELGQKYYPANKLEFKEKIVIGTGEETDITDIADRIVLNEYAPCGALIDSSMGIVRFRGHTGRFLESAAGKPSLDIFKLAREGLLLPMRSAIHKARKTKHTVKKEAGNVLCNGHKISVMITVIPLKSAALKEEFFLVLFTEIGRTARDFKNLPRGLSKISLKGKSVEKNGYIKDLEKELAETKEYLQTVIEEQGNVNEELKTANEEILSSNEELQSTNEELETAKEELQSSNEELTTTNEELQNRNSEVILLNNDLINLLGSINIPVVMVGVDLAIRRVTPQAGKALNVTSSDVGRPISKIKLNIDIPDIEKTLSDVIESLNPKIFEIKDKDGNWYSACIRPYRTMDNKIDGVVMVFIDITESKRAQQVVEESRAYAENIIESMPEPLVVLGDDLKVISANRSFYRVFKVRPKETKGYFIYDLGNRQWDIPKLRQLLEDILPKKSTIDEYEIEHKFETIGHKTMLLNAKRLTNMHMILITINDITERKKMGEELKKIDQLKSDFVSTVSHELRTPLATMKEFTAILSDEIPGKLTKDQREYINIIKGNIDRLTRLISNLLDISKIEAGKVEFKRGLCDFAGLVKQTAETFEPQTREKGLELKIDIPQKPIDMYVDDDKIIQVITNLLSNALKFTEKGFIELSVRESKNEVECAVADTGRGIAKENLPKVFEKFQQFERTSGAGAKGTGLGLAITRDLIGMHSGRIWVESQLGKGTRLTFSLPKYTTEALFKEYVDNGVKEAMKKGSQMSLIVVSIAKFERLKEEVSDDQVQSILKDVEDVLKNSLRRSGDVAVKNTGEFVVILADCDKKNALSVEVRFKQALEDYFARQNLARKIELRFGCATYPDEANNHEELINKARQA